MKRLLQIGCVLLLAGAVVIAEGRKQAGSDAAARATAVKLFESLTPEQKKLALKEFNDKERYVEAFPAVQRPGLPFKELRSEQKALVDEMVRAMTSEYGASRCLEVAKQTPASHQFLNFFGAPDAKKPFAWRIGMHHLTLIYAEFGNDKANEFGPVLLGGNPVNTLWDDEDKIVVELAAALSPEEAKAIKGKGNAGSGAAIDAASMRIGDLSAKPKALAHKLLEQRLAVFSDDRRKPLVELIEREGGIDKLRIGIWGDASKPRRDGGKYNWKIGGSSVLCDWQTVDKNHIHMTVRGRVKS